MRARQTHSGELEGMRKEVSRLTAELHRRDLTIASMEALRMEQNTGEPKVGQPSCDAGNRSLVLNNNLKKNYWCQAIKKKLICLITRFKIN